VRVARPGRHARHTARHRRLLLAVAAAAATLALVPAAASAHPLGNFTINHFAAVRVSPTGIALDVVIDRAEIPTFSERQRIDTDGDGQVSAAEIEAERQTACERLAPSVELTIGGDRASIVVQAAGVSFPPGAGGLSTMRVVCQYAAALTAPLAPATPIHFAETSEAGRIGWREIIVSGDRMTIGASSLASTSVSDRLTHYPADLLAVPLAIADTSFTATPGGPSVAAPCIADAFPLTSDPTDATPGFGCAASVTTAPGSTSSSGAGVAAGLASSGASAGAGGSGSSALASTAASVPGGVGADVAGLLQTRDLTPPIVLFSILTAMALGAAHAVTPGHGKTIMAAYLVGTRGTPRHAVALGLTVTASHTLGVLLLAAVVLSVSRITPESFNHVAGIASGLLVVAIGGWLFLGQGLPMLRSRFVAWRAERARVAAQAAVHDEAHGAGQAHEHPHEHDHDVSGVEHGHDHGGATPGGWHEHGGHGHSHLPAGGATLTWRSLFALGLFGGLVPSINALIILLATLATGRAAFGLVLVVAFGAGMAIVLGGVGLGLVYASRRMAATSSIPLQRLVAWAPALTAMVIVVVGLWVTSQAIWGSSVL
jgi:nickel/cobalt exporter